MIKAWLIRIGNTPYVQKAISDQADLAIFKQKPSRRTVWGLITIGISYTIGWPVISVLGILSVYWKEPLLLVIDNGVRLFLGRCSNQVAVRLDDKGFAVLTNL